MLGVSGGLAQLDMRFHFLITLILTISLSTAATPVAPASLKEHEVIKLANAAAMKKGYKLEDYEKPKAKYEVSWEPASWIVSYQGKLRAPGNHFFVIVDDKTKSTELWPGE